MNDMDYMEQRMVKAESRVHELEAQCAAMHHVLDLCGQKFMFLTGEVEYQSANEEKRAHDAISKVYPKVLNALSTTAGKKLLERLAKAEAQVSDMLKADQDNANEAHMQEAYRLDLEKAYNLKIQEWWWRIRTQHGNMSLQLDMESFMREHQIPMERPK